MQAHARIVADVDDHGRTRLVTMRSDAPLLVRETPDAVYLVGGAAGPLGGDELAFDVEVLAGARLTVRSAAAVLAQPGARGGRSRQHTRLTIGSGARLDLRPEPLVSVRGSDHTIDTVVTMHGTAALHLVEELVLGRHEEASGRLRTRIRVERDGVALLTHELDVGADAPGWRSGAIIGTARAIVSEVVIGEDAPSAPSVHRDHETSAMAAWLPLAPGAAMLLALGPGLRVARHAADALRHPCRGETPTERTPATA